MEKKNPKADDRKVGDTPTPEKLAEAKAKDSKTFKGQGTEKKG